MTPRQPSILETPAPRAASLPSEETSLDAAPGGESAALLRHAVTLACQWLSEGVSSTFCEWCQGDAPRRDYDGLLLGPVSHAPDCPFGLLDDALQDQEVRDALARAR